MTAPGFCNCGCGGTTTLARDTDASWGTKKGVPRRFVVGHANRNGALPVGVRVMPNGYVKRRVDGHPRADKPKHGYVFEHILVVEGALGHYLARPAVVHHVNGDHGDNRPANLVACQNDAYHHLLHCRQRALTTCGNPAWRPCEYCGTHDDPRSMVSHSGRSYYHRSCAALSWDKRKGEAA